jgi:nucleoside 2-deoxyribosyltransferase
MTKIYLADKFAHREKMRHVAQQLRDAGHEITSQWIDIGDGTTETNVTDEVRVSGAKMDLDDVDRAHVLLAFSYPRGLPSTGGGRHVEFGYAIAHGKQVIVVGPKGEHIFHWAPGVLQFEALDEAMGAL